MGEIDQNSELEGLSGIKVSIRDRIYLYVADIPTSFSTGKGTRKEPLVPLGNVHIKDALENAKDIAELAEEYGLEKTIFFRHNARVFGVNSKAHVQLVKEKWWSESDLNHEVGLLESVLSSLKERENRQQDPDRWTIRVIDEK